jgi:hypothetical protein
MGLYHTAVCGPSTLKMEKKHSKNIASIMNDENQNTR